MDVSKALFDTGFSRVTSVVAALAAETAPTSRDLCVFLNIPFAIQFAYAAKAAINAFHGFEKPAEPSLSSMAESRSGILAYTMRVSDSARDGMKDKRAARRKESPFLFDSLFSF